MTSRPPPRTRRTRFRPSRSTSRNSMSERTAVKVKHTHRHTRCHTPPPNECPMNARSLASVMLFTTWEEQTTMTSPSVDIKTLSTNPAISKKTICTIYNFGFWIDVHQLPRRRNMYEESSAGSVGSDTGGGSGLSMMDKHRHGTCFMPSCLDPALTQTLAHTNPLYCPAVTNVYLHY